MGNCNIISGFVELDHPVNHASGVNHAFRHEFEKGEGDVMHPRNASIPGEYRPEATARLLVEPRQKRPFLITSKLPGRTKTEQDIYAPVESRFRQL
ncbi:hypothetical protein EAG_10552 [Camponotus floridanus]|uniref:Uncharacterized protein n=1 Tax=Camponotus floridanus TaxID=104421 RepID=E2B0U6_CAMFO|nr:hypothetical protein EAG_10552 [Camponotus floridanus]